MYAVKHNLPIPILLNFVGMEKMLPVGTSVQMLKGPKGVAFRVGRVIEHIKDIGYKVKYKNTVYVFAKDDVIQKTNKEISREFYKYK